MAVHFPKTCELWSFWVYTVCGIKLWISGMKDYEIWLLCEVVGKICQVVGWNITGVSSKRNNTWLFRVCEHNVWLQNLGTSVVKGTKYIGIIIGAFWFESLLPIHWDYFSKLMPNLDATEYTTFEIAIKLTIRNFF